MLLPADFIVSIQTLLGSEGDALFAALEEEAPVSIRLNPGKTKRNPLRFSGSYERVPWAPKGYYLPERPPFTFDPLFHSGYYYVQEAASMFVETVVRQSVHPLEGTPLYALDLCAAPGGKSLGLLSALPADALLVSNEVIRSRANVLSETVIKFGVSNQMVTQNVPADFASLPRFFDLILADAPCSGEGMFRKDAVAIEEWSLRNVEMCAARQRQIVNDVWPALKPGGLLIYSTCTFNLHEDEENAFWMARELEADFVEVATDDAWNITPSLDGNVVAYRFFPHKTKGEGLFVTVLRKKGEGCSPPKIPRIGNTKKPSPFVKDTSRFRHWLHPAEGFDYFEKGQKILALPRALSEVMVVLSASLKTVSMGIELGEERGKDLFPSHSLAMSQALEFNAFCRYEVTYEQAVSYLKGESLLLFDAPKGYLLLTYKHEPIGFVKNIGNRANNLYPREWRIKSGYLPERRPQIFV